MSKVLTAARIVSSGSTQSRLATCTIVALPLRTSRTACRVSSMLRLPGRPRVFDTRVSRTTVRCLGTSKTRFAGISAAVTSRSASSTCDARGADSAIRAVVLHVHLHTCALDVVYVEAEEGDALRFVAAAPPSRADLYVLAERVALRVMTWLRKRGVVVLGVAAPRMSCRPSASVVLEAAGHRRYLSRQMRASVLSLVSSGALLLPTVAFAAPLIINGSTTVNTCPGGTVRDGGRACEYGGTRSFDYVELRNGAVLCVRRFNGTDKANTGNLVLKATGRDPTNSIRVDATSRIVAKGLGYQAKVCDNGPGPASAPLSGGRGGCAVLDGAGGGGHLGSGGRGTKSNPAAYPAGYEEACGSLAADALSCSGTVGGCVNGDGLPSVAGQAFSHSAYVSEFGAAGGDKGCRDGGGFDSAQGGSGGGRLVLFAANAGETGLVRIDGRVIADGNRGCAAGDDPGGGGAGGTILFVADAVQVAASARISAHGGQGGSAAPKCLPCSTNADCSSGQTCQTVADPQTGASQKRCGPCNCTPCTSSAQCDAALGQSCKNLGGAVGTVCADASNQCMPTDPGDNDAECIGTQNSGSCVACCGGGGGGLIEVHARSTEIDPLAIVDARGGRGGVCPVCVGEAGEVSPRVRVNLGYAGEICDGIDNDFDGVVDNGLPMLQCAGGVEIASCVGGVAQSCPVDPATCSVVSSEALPRFVVLFGTSGSMLGDAAGNPLFGDGSQEFPGVATGASSRLALARGRRPASAPPSPRRRT